MSFSLSFMASPVEALDSWVGRYIKAWASNDPDDIGVLFTREAKYYTAPFGKPWDGLQAIVDGWIDRKDSAGNYEFRYEILGLIGRVGYVRGWTRYKKPATTYHNLWQVKLEADGTCSEFTEWWMAEEPPKK
jgi:hypothetical protein